MNIKIAILTKETPHHVHFVREILNYYKDLKIFFETGKIKNQPFKTSHPFEKKRKEFEISKWFKNNRLNLSNFVDTEKFYSINDIDAVRSIKQYNADLVVVFGTIRIENIIIDLNSSKIFNLHGGDPERYRGLDSHLWSIYHNDFSALLTTLHIIKPKLDTGDIVAQCSVPITKNLPLYALRAMNTEMCIKLTLNLIDTFVKYGNIASRPQRKLGRYYSAMPKDLKTICFQKFKNFTRNI